MERFIDYKIMSDNPKSIAGLWDKIKKADYSKGVFCISSEKHYDNKTITILCKLPDYPTSRLFVGLLSDGISILNIVPTEESGTYELKKSEYNHILKSYVKEIIAPLLTPATEFTINETPDHYSIEDLIPKSQKVLSTWVNGFPHSSHPCDTKRWFDFLISLMDNEEELSSDDFEKYLQEVGWKEKDIVSQIIKYEEEKDLLTYDRLHRNV